MASVTPVDAVGVIYSSTTTAPCSVMDTVMNITGERSKLTKSSEHTPTVTGGSKSILPTDTTVMLRMDMNSDGWVTLEMLAGQTVAINAYTADPLCGEVCADTADTDQKTRGRTTATLPTGGITPLPELSESEATTSGTRRTSTDSSE